MFSVTPLGFCSLFPVGQWSWAGGFHFWVFSFCSVSLLRESLDTALAGQSHQIEVIPISALLRPLYPTRVVVKDLSFTENSGLRFSGTKHVSIKN